MGSAAAEHDSVLRLGADSLWDVAAVLLEDRADCVVIDLTQPGGLKALKKLRALAPDLPIVALTDADDGEQSLAALKAGAQDHLPKEEADEGTIARAVRHARERAELGHAQATRDRAQAVAEQLQRALLPDGLPSIVGIELAARYLPRSVGASVGGDWYDVIETPDGRVAIAIGDVTGSGATAAALMGQLRTALRAYALEGHPPGQVLTKTDAYARSLRPGVMATVLLLSLDLEERNVRAACAGHLPPILLRPDGTARRVDLAISTPLGTGPPAAYSESALVLEPGDGLVLVTDGLIESRHSPLPAGIDRLEEALATGPRDPELLCDHLLTSVTPAAAGEDDIALLVARFPEAMSTQLSLKPEAVPRSLSSLRNTVGRWLRQNGANSTEAYELIVALGEAAANAIEHAYPPGEATFDVHAELAGREVRITVRDQGRWRPPRGDDQGRGLALMEALCHRLELTPSDSGTTVRMMRVLGDADDTGAAC